MGRRHLRSAVATDPGVWSRTFTLKELTRRAHAVGARKPGESLAGWLDRVHHGRERSALLGDDPRDDVADPIGGPEHLYEATASELAGLIDELVDLAFASADHDRESA